MLVYSNTCWRWAQFTPQSPTNSHQQIKKQRNPDIRLNTLLKVKSPIIKITEYITYNNSKTNLSI